MIVSTAEDGSIYGLIILLITLAILIGMFMYAMINTDTTANKPKEVHTYSRIATFLKNAFYFSMAGSVIAVTLLVFFFNWITISF
jgi:putative effector of murein hydrolase LrgA (UPF0299 family)